MNLSINRFASPSLVSSFENRLSSFVENAILSYDYFSSQEHWGDARSFTMHQMACRAALLHLETLLRIAPGLRAATLAEDSALTCDIEAILRHADREIEQYEG